MRIMLVGGTNVLADTEPEGIKTKTLRILTGERRRGDSPELWDGKTAERIVRILSAQ